MTPIAPGSRVEIRDELWIVRRVDPSSDGGLLLTCDGVSELVRDKNALFLTKLEDDLVILDPAETKLVPDQSSNFNSSLLYLGSMLRRNIPNDNNIHLGHQAVMKLKDYQLKPSLQGLEQPRTRILIADAVGLGKTLEAGILVTELIQRGQGKRILVVTQKSMLSQFQKEFWTRFTIPLVRLDSVGIARVRNRIPANYNPFNYYERSIISMDTLKDNLEYRNYLEKTWWDIIIIDECHNVALRGSEQTMSSRARLARRLANCSDTLILLSATPHDGSAKSFASLMNLLDPTAIGDPEHFTPDDYRDKGLVIRRFRSDIQQEAGQDFPTRKLEEIKHLAGPGEEAAYRALLEIPFTQRGEHRPGQQKELQRVGTQKGLFSSPAAAIASAKERINKLENKETTTAAELEEVRHQQHYLECLEAIQPLNFTKYQCLLKLLKGLENPDHSWDASREDDRLVIFSERIETLNWLEQHLTKDLSLSESQVQLLHGGMSDTDQQEIVDRFGRLNDPVRLLLCSDVASEGLNLHFFCHRLIHFDLPWSLMTFQQRNGRIDRFGQTQQPLIFWFVNLVEIEKIRGDQRILEILIQKEKQAYENLGDPSVFLNVHEPEKEEAKVQEMMASGESAESISAKLDKNAGEAQEQGTEWWMEMFQAEEEGGNTESLIEEDIRFFQSDWHFMKTGLDEMSEAREVAQFNVSEDNKTISLTAPADLRERLKQIPREAHAINHQYVLTTKKELVESAIEQARQAEAGEDSWPELSYLWTQHPIMEWLVDRLSSHFGRHQAPVIRSSEMNSGEHSFVMMAIIPNKKGQPLLVEWQVASRQSDGSYGLESFKSLVERLKLKAGAQPNPGNESIPKGLQESLPEAVRLMKKHMVQKQKDFDASLQVKLEKTMELLKTLQERQFEQLELLLEKQLDTVKDSKRKKRKQEIDGVFDSYRNWVENTLSTEPEPYIQVLAAMCPMNA